MSTAQLKPAANGTARQDSPAPARKSQPLHFIRQVRKQQGISLRSAARRMQLDVADVKGLEDESSDMPLSMLYRWQRALEVPVANLLVDDDDGLADPIMKRARLVRLMKTAAAILEKAESDSQMRLAQMLVEQLVEIMPELREVSPWHAVGQRRSLDECGRIAEQPVSEDWFFHAGC